MAWLKEEKGAISKYPYTKKDLHKDHPNTGFPSKLDEETLNSFGVKKVIIDHTVPELDEDTQELVLGYPVKNKDGVYVRSYEVRNLPEDVANKKVEQSIKKVERQSDEKLDEVLREVLVDYILKGEPVPKKYSDYIESLNGLKKNKIKKPSWPAKPERTK